MANPNISTANIVKISDNPVTYRVQSHTNKSLEYTVIFHDTANLSKSATCTCKGFGYRRQCSHIDEVVVALKSKTPLAELHDIVDMADTIEGADTFTRHLCKTCNAPLTGTHALLDVCPQCLRKEALHPNA